MADVILFHHVLGPTPGVQAFADRLRAAGHRVTVPDLLEGARFDTIEAGVAHAEAVGFETIIARGLAAADGLPPGAVYAGFSLGVLPAQKLAQTRPGARAALLYHAAVPPGTFADRWPDGVALQIHLSDGDPWAGEDRPAAEALVADAADAELFVYPGPGHLFMETGHPDHDPASAALALERTLRLLSRWP
jgi:dienelactone hydrolase